METHNNSTESAGTNAVAFEPFINKMEVAKRLGIKPRTTDDWVSRGLLVHYKVGRSIRFKWSEIERHLGQTCRVCRRSEGK